MARTGRALVVGAVIVALGIGFASLKVNPYLYFAGYVILQYVVIALLGLGIGYLTLRLRGTFFSIATLALSVVLQTVIINWEYVGGSRGMSVLRPSGPPFGNYVMFLFTVMMTIAV